MNLFEHIKTRYSLETNIKGIEYIESLEKEHNRQRKRIYELSEEKHDAYVKLNKVSEENLRLRRALKAYGDIEGKIILNALEESEKFVEKFNNGEID